MIQHVPILQYNNTRVQEFEVVEQLIPYRSLDVSIFHWELLYGDTLLMNGDTISRKIGLALRQVGKKLI